MDILDPKEGMSTVRKKPRYTEVDGYRYPLSFLPDIVRSGIRYQPNESDVFVVTYPKCGTTWMIQIVLLILRRGELPSSTKEYFGSNIFLEFLGADAVRQMIRPGCIKTHFPLHLTPFSQKAKYLYVTRNPMDCCISFYHHTKFFPIYHFSDGTFEDFFELFITGQTDFNDYFDNLLPWYERRNDANVFFTTFERMKANHKRTVLQVAEFLGDDHLVTIQKDNNLLNKVLQKSTMECMKGEMNDWRKDMAVASDNLFDDDASPMKQHYQKLALEALKEGHSCTGDFIRKGNSGEWKAVFTADQEQRMNERIMEKTKCSDVMSLWN